MKELDTVVLRRLLPDFGLAEGDLGSGVHVRAADAFEGEFGTGEGTTLAVATLSSDDLRRIEAHELLYVGTE